MKLELDDLQKIMRGENLFLARQAINILINQVDLPNETLEKIIFDSKNDQNAMALYKAFAVLPGEILKKLDKRILSYVKECDLLPSEKFKETINKLFEEDPITAHCFLSQAIESSNTVIVQISKYLIPLIETELNNAITLIYPSP